MSDERSKPSFWETLPGIIAAIAGLITAIAALITALYSAKIIGQNTEVQAESKAVSVVSTEAKQHVAQPIKKKVVLPVIPKQGDTITDPTTGMKLVYIPKGCFQMGSPANEKDRHDREGPVHEVCVDGFWMGKYEVTQGQWQKVMGDNPSYNKGNDYPVEQVSWDDTQKFFTQLNQKSAKEYRLPTEAEWEYACRANGKGKYCGGDNLDALAWYWDNSGKNTHIVGGKQVNNFGLYDMSGNVWEWCADWYGDYTASRQDNPQGLTAGTYRVVRGGSWTDRAGYCRSAFRGRNEPDGRLVDTGFRCVRVQ
ncbi:MAG: formylglycine-generating enzyme family protein [Candidatus Electrothrix sp. AR3]|nr:formylglycine-generating enzyme family protein [Candidatus Electrothrix sp. AR3]